MQKTALHKKISRLLLFLVLAVTAFATCTNKDNENNGIPQPPGASGYTLIISKAYTFGTTTTIEVDSLETINVHWESSNPGAVEVINNTEMFEIRGSMFTDLIVVVRVTSVVNLKTGNLGSAELTAVVNYKNGGQPFFRRIPVSLTVLNIPSENDEKGIEINGIMWATRNVNTSGTFVPEPENLGLFYRWGSNVDWNGQNTIIPWRSDSTTWQKTNDPCPKEWRMPTHEELQSLARAQKTWGERNGVNGYWFVDDIDDDQLIFLPAAGYRLHNDGWLYLSGSFGHYWSNALDTDSTRLDTINIARGMDFGSKTEQKPFAERRYNRDSGFSCRCVKE